MKTQQTSNTLYSLKQNNNDESALSSPNNNTTKTGTILSAQFNLLSSMVGGGCLSLPLAFYDIGIGLSGPLLVLFSSIAADYSIKLLIESSKLYKSKSNSTYDTLVSHAFGSYSQGICQSIVFFLCFMTCIGYGIILRDLISPIADLIHPKNKTNTDGPTFFENGVMLVIIFFVTPLCCLENLTSLKNVGILSMASIIIVGTCVIYRSIECNFYSDANHFTFGEYLTWTQFNFREYLDAFPLVISVFVCHFNVLPVYHELENATDSRVNFLIHSTVAIAFVFYISVGFWGAMYGNCTDAQKVSGNILLDFDEDDPLVCVARVCLGITVICMYPMLVTPARNILMDVLSTPHKYSNAVITIDDQESDSHSSPAASLKKPLLLDYEAGLKQNDQDTSPLFHSQSSSSSLSSDNSSLKTQESKQAQPHEENNEQSTRIVAACSVLWSAGFLACFVSQLDTVWGLLGSTFSILIGYLLPCGVYLVLKYNDNKRWSLRMIISFLWVCIFTPMLVLCTANSISNAFISH